MHRPTLFLITALSLVFADVSQAQTSAERRAEQAREAKELKAEKDREAKERAAERARETRERNAERARERAAERAERERAGALDTVIAFDARGIISVSCPGGSVIITGSDRNEIRVRARTESGAIRFTASGNRATLEPSTSGRSCSDGRFEVTVPQGAKVTAITWSGEARVSGVHGDLDVHSQSGDVEVRDAGDRLDVESLSGDVIVSGVKGEANLHTVSGDLQLSGVRGSVVIETISGDLDLRDIVTRNVRINSSNGDISFQGPILDGGRYEFKTHSGEVGLVLGADLGAELTLSTFSGGIESDFPITLKGGGNGIGSSQAKRLSFTVGKGTARIIAETFSGDITLRRRR